MEVLLLFAMLRRDRIQPTLSHTREKAQLSSQRNESQNSSRAYYKQLSHMLQLRIENQTAVLTAGRLTFSSTSCNQDDDFYKIILKNELIEPQALTRSVCVVFCFLGYLEN